MSPGLVRRSGLATATESLAGSLLAGFAVAVALQPYPFVPMLHNAGPTLMFVTGDVTDQADPDLPTLGWANTSGISLAWDVDYRYVAA